MLQNQEKKSLMKKGLITLFILLIFNNSQAGWFDKKIKVENCFDHKKFKNFKEAKRAGATDDSFWEIDIENNTAVASFKYLNRRILDKYSIKAKTDNYVIVAQDVTDARYDAHFDLKNKTLSFEFPNNINSFQKCDFN
jgi:hypothetical protein